MTINITFIAVWIAQFNLYLWKRRLSTYDIEVFAVAIDRIKEINVDIERLKAKSKPIFKVS